MMDKKEIEEFFGKYIAIGVPHDKIPGRLFFYYGFLKYVTDEELKMKMSNGFKIIPLEQVKDIHLGDE